MVNTTAIGNRTADHARKQLLEAGFSFQGAKKGRYLSKWGWRSYGEDFFGVFDAIAIHKETGDMRFLQFTTQGPTTSIGQLNVRRNKLIEFAKLHNYSSWEATIEFWTWIKRKGFTYEILMSDYSWSTREHFNSSVSRVAEGAAGGKVDRRAAPDGKSGERVSPTPMTPAELNRAQNLAFRMAFKLPVALTADSIRAYAETITKEMPKQ